MPITEPLKTAEDLDRMGLAPAIAGMLDRKFEETTQATHESAKDFIRQELLSSCPRTFTERPPPQRWGNISAF